MTTHLRNPLILVWLILVVLTIASGWLSREGVSDHTLSTLTTMGVLLVAAVKSQLVIRYFMEVRHAPGWLKKVTAGWLLVVTLLLLISYWLSH